MAGILFKPGFYDRVYNDKEQAQREISERAE